jgi:hypothetical protein
MRSIVELAWETSLIKDVACDCKMVNSFPKCGHMVGQGVKILGQSVKCFITFFNKKIIPILSSTTWHDII